METCQRLLGQAGFREATSKEFGECGVSDGSDQKIYGTYSMGTIPAQ